MQFVLVLNHLNPECVQIVLCTLFKTYFDVTNTLQPYIIATSRHNFRKLNFLRIIGLVANRAVETHFKKPRFFRFF